MNCSYCATELLAGAMFCGECGRSTGARAEPQPAAPAGTGAAPADTCAQCGQKFDEPDIFCSDCGFVRSRLSSPPSPSPSPPPPPSPPPVAMPLLDHTTSASVDTVAFSESDLADIEKTRIVSHTPGGERFVLQFSTGESVTVFGTGMVGRHPVAEPSEYFDTFVTIVDPGKSVSKTHLEFGQDGGHFWVSDRFSGNGTVVREPDAPPHRCEPGTRARIARGSRVEIGEQFFIVS